MKQLGMLVLANTVIIAGYCLFATSIDAKKVGIFSGIAAFIGLALMIGDRLTGVKIEGVGELTAATQRAVTGAENIEKIEKEVEGHRDSIGMIVRDANKAQEDIKRIDDYASTAKQKAEEAEKAAKEAKESQARLEGLAEFNALVTRANNDDRKAFDKLRTTAEKKDGSYHDIARKVVISIVARRNLKLGADLKLLKNSGFDATAEPIGNYYKWVFHERQDIASDALEQIWKQERFTKRQRLDFVYLVLCETASIEVLETARSLLDEEAKINRNILLWPEYQRWWNDHHEEYK